MLQNCRSDYPDYKVITRRIKKNPSKESYKGLTYEYMRTYILMRDPNPNEALAEFNAKRLVSMCHSKRYPVIKAWFLEKYPDVLEFGMVEFTPSDYSREKIEKMFSEAV